MTVASLFFVVETRPQPQGSMVRGRHGGMHSDNQHLAGFRDRVAWEARAALRDGPVPMVGEHVPVQVELDFYFERPKSVPKSRIFPSVRVDGDKCERACLDAMKGIIYVDDGQVMDSHWRKWYGMPERVEVSVRLAATDVLPSPAFSASTGSLQS